jgi:putative ABC transport system permease protein
VIGLIALNMARNRGRTVLTALGIAIGVATIVALLALSQGLKRSVGGLSNLGGASFGLFQSGVADPTASVLPKAILPKVRAEPGVEDAAPIQLVTNAVPGSPASLVFGVSPQTFPAKRLVYTSGRPPTDEEVAIGQTLAGQRNLSPGGRIVVKGRRFRISGVYESGVAFEDSGVVVDLPVAEQLSGRTGGVTTIAVNLRPSASLGSVTTEMREDFPGVTTIANPGEAARANPSLEVVTKAVLVIAILALVLGGIAVTNTIAMAVLERQRELALMGAIGWSPLQVATLVVGEGVGVGLIGAAVGVIAGAAVSHLVVNLVGAADFVSPAVTAWGVGRGFLIGAAIGVLGGIYPAWRVSRRPPAELLGRF